MQRICVLNKSKEKQKTIKREINRTFGNFDFDYKIKTYEQLTNLLKMTKRPDLIIMNEDLDKFIKNRKRILCQFPYVKLIYVSTDYHLENHKAAYFNVIGSFIENEITTELQPILLEWYEHVFDTRFRFTTTIKGDILSVPYAEIQLIYYDDRKVYLRKFNEETIYINTMSFKSFVTQFKHEKFIQINQSCLVNLDAIEKITRGKLHIKDLDYEISISRILNHQIKQRFLEYLAQSQSV